MSILSIMNKMADKLVKRNNSFETYSTEKQRFFLENLKVPSDDIERSFNQYLCQMEMNGKLVTFLINIASLPLLICFYYKKNSIPESHEQKIDAVFFADGKPNNILPEQLASTVKQLRVVCNKKENLNDVDREFFRKICKKYPMSWHFLLKCLMKIRFYSYEIETYAPTMVVACNEYSFTSSVLTSYCELYGIKHVNVMHGEKLFYIRDAFFRFHECYVWDEYYADLFKRLKAEPTQFKVELPKSMRFSEMKGEKKIDYTYYLGAESGKVLEEIIGCMIDLAKEGYYVAIRPHPRYTNLSELKVKLEEIELENPLSMPIEESILRTKNAISTYSTVLNQAYHNGTKIVIDDISKPELFKNLRSLEYIMLAKEHSLLSKLIQRECKDK